HNRAIAWTATTAYPDVMDLLDVPYDEDSVTVAGEPIAIEASEETVEVRDGEPRVVTIEDVPGYGVLLPDGLAPLPIVDLGHRLLLRWPGRKATREGSSVLELDLATGLDDFDAAVAKNEIGNFNFLAISAEGLTYRSLPETPLHVNVRDDAPPYRVIDASDPANLWQTMVAQELLPQSRAATRGWLASANNDPFGFTADNSLEGDAFYYGIFFDPGTRAGRIEQELTRLTAEGPVSKADMMALQTDTYSLLADALLPVLLEAHAAVPNDDALAAFRDRPDLDALVTLLDDWDRRMERDSAAALVHHALLWFVTKNVLRDDLGPVFDAVSDESPIYTLKWALLTVTRAYAAADELMQEGRDLLVMQALDETAAFLVERFGTTDPSAYAWRDFHATRFGSLWGDALASEPVATDGADGTVNVSAAAFLRDGEPVERHLSGSGAIYRFVATLDGDGVPRAELHFPRGNSGEPTSPYFSNNLEDWVEDRYRPLLFRTEEVMAGSEEMVELSP
ncbi:MAG: penicillin acylase family protein, partial [Myxococcales bacterium]|nr:penicillin acylase family protein [Myxococcales bacterium]